MLSMNSAVFPAAVAATLHECCENARALPLDDLMASIENGKTGLGRRIHDVFVQIESKALAAASIAQVHRATLKRCGTEVLVKVQHPGVKDSMAADVAILPLIISLVDMIEPNHGLRPMMSMIESMLRQEMDFRIEGANRERLAAVVERSERTGRSKFANVRFPEVYWEYCCETVMVQEFALGAVSLGDRDAVQGLGIPYAIALREVSTFFAEGAFVHGYMHNDLHTGNAMVAPCEKAPSGRLQRLCRTPRVVPRLLALLYAAGALAAVGAAYALVYAPLLRLVGGTVLAWPLYAVREVARTAVYVLALAAASVAADGGERAAAILRKAAAGDGDDGASDLDRATGFLEAHPRLAAAGEQIAALHATAQSYATTRCAEIADARFDLIIIDHGFHTHVSYETRLAWCKCWAALGLCDEALLIEAATDFGLSGDDYKQLSLILSAFPYPCWKERRYPTIREWLKLVKSEEWGLMGAAAEVLNKKMPREFHLMHRTSQQVGALFQIEYGMGWKSGLEFLRLMTRHALLGLRFRNRDAAVLPVPGNLRTADRAFFDAESAAVDARMEADFYWNYPSSLKGQMDESVLDLMLDDDCAARLDDDSERVSVATAK